MKTPYDAALRAQRYEVDRLRVEAAALCAQLAACDAGIAALDRVVADEATLARPFDGFAAYAARIRHERAQLEGQRLSAQRALDAVELAVIAGWRDLKPLQSAAEGYLAARRQRQAQLETAALDEAAAQAHRRQSAC